MMTMLITHNKPKILGESCNYRMGKGERETTIIVVYIECFYSFCVNTNNFRKKIIKEYDIKIGILGT